jgi:ATP-dependent DNA helicase RecQ
MYAGYIPCPLISFKILFLIKMMGVLKCYHNNSIIFAMMTITYDTKTFMNSPKQILSRYYGYDSFRDNQEEVIDHILSGNDALVIMPTGGGKSVCFQVPAMCLPGLTLVISPLLALMQDQVTNLKAIGIPAEAYNSMATETELANIRMKVRNQEVKILYVSPERLNTQNFYDFIKEIQLSLVAVDEAHCVSIWGNDFRSDYLAISQFRNTFYNIPFIALTATADAVTQQDICNQLHLKSYKIFISSFERKNITIQVRQGLKRLEQIVKFIDENEGSGIIYCLSRKNTESLAEALAIKGYDTSYYHAGMDNETRKRVQDNFINDKVSIICATIAFGMGVDKPNIRWVIHYNLPKNIESFYQEIGRAGRDSLPANSLLFYSFQDMEVMKGFIFDSEANEEFKNVQLDKIERVWDFANSSECRTNVILNYFGEYRDIPCGHCDNCLEPPKKIDGTQIAQMALSAIYRTNQQLTIQFLIDVLRGSGKAEIRSSGYDQIKTYGVGRNYSQFEWRDYIVQLLHKGYISLDYTNGYKLKLTGLAHSVLFEKQKIQLVSPLFEKPSKKQKVKENDLLPKITANQSLLDKLKVWRLEKAKAEGVPPYIVFNDNTLQALSNTKIESESDLEGIIGIGQMKLKKYGSEVFEIISEFALGRKASKTSTFTETLRLLNEGHSFEEIAQLRNIGVSTVVEHIVKSFKEGAIDSIDAYVDTEVYEEIIGIAKEIESFDRLRPIYDHLQQKYTFDQIKFALAKYSVETKI